jgi:CRP-like cAMP-binding protein
MRMLVTRLRDADSKRVEFTAFDTVGRVARRLVELAERFGTASDDRVEIALALSQEELAGWTGSSREAVSKALQSLRGRGWIETKRRGITILDLDALRKRST